MSDDDNLPRWRKKFLAARRAFESILFEGEFLAPKPKKKRSGILILLALFLFHSLLLAQAALRGGGNLPEADAAAIETAYDYAQALDSGSYSRLFKPEIFSSSGFKPPLYYLSFYPALKLFPSNPPLALATVNSFYLLLIMLFLFFAVRKGRNFPSAWFAASLAAAFPFVIAAGRHASPDMALMAFVTGAYCCYINSSEFEARGWSVLFGVVFSLGLLSDTRYIIYVFPLLVFALNAFLNPLTRRNMTCFYLLLLLLPAPWYFRNFVFSFLRDLFVGNNFSAAAGLGSISPLNILRDLPQTLDCMHLPFFVVGIVSMLWLWLSVLMVYAEKEIILVWFLFPYCVFSLFSRAGGGNIYPAVIPFALAAGIMAPDQIRKRLLGLTLLLPALYQFGFVPGMAASVGGKQTGIFGLDLTRGRDLRTEEALKAVYASGGGRNLRVQLVGEGAYFNLDSLKLLARKLGYAGMSFVSYPKDYMGLADFVIYKSAGFSTSYGSGRFKKYSDEIAAAGGWFSSVFSLIASFDTADTSKLTVYAKSGPRPEFLAAGNYTFERLSLGGVTFEDAIADVGAFNEAAGGYEFFELFIPHLQFHGADLYSLRFRFEGFSILPVSEDFTDIRLTGCDSVRILSLKLREKTLNKLLKAGSPYFQNLRVRLDNGLSILGTYRDINVNAGFAVTPAGAGFKLKLTRLLLEGLGSEDIGGREADDAHQTETRRAPDRRDSQVSDPRKELAQYSGDTVVAGIFKDSGYDKLIQSADEAAKKDEVVKPRRNPAPTPPASPLSTFLTRLFSTELNLLDEKSVPFKVKTGGISLKNGLLVVY